MKTKTLRKFRAEVAEKYVQSIHQKTSIFRRSELVTEPKQRINDEPLRTKPTTGARLLVAVEYTKSCDRQLWISESCVVS